MEVYIMQILGQQMGPITMLPKAKYLLDEGVAVIVFRKKTGEVRVMLCTRSYYTCNLMNIDPHIGDRKNKDKFEADGNITVMDLIAGDTRIVNIHRVMYSLWMNGITNADEIEMIMAAYNYCKEQWPQYDDMDPYHQALFLKTFSYPAQQ